MENGRPDPGGVAPPGAGGGACRYRFERYLLDPVRHELLAGDLPVPLEPQVFALLTYLVRHRDRVVGKDELLEAVWEGREVTESALSSRVKSARQALGDDGREQRLIRTLHGVGFRFVGVVEELGWGPVVSAEAAAPTRAPSAGGRPGIAVLPFRAAPQEEGRLSLAEALPAELITALSRLRWLFVIARASSFQFRGEGGGLDRVRQALGVRYCLTGSLELTPGELAVTVELSDTGDRGVVWGERYLVAPAAVHEVRERIVRAVLAALELHIPLQEARRAQLAAPADLDAWGAYHLGLRHMYRFTRSDNERATGYFRRAVALEPDFARAHAGLSFTAFQDAFLRYTPDLAEAAVRAQRSAEACLERDPLEPFGHLTLGRALWLRDDLEGARPWLERARTLSPSYAQAHYAAAFTEALLGSIGPSHALVDQALALSPVDPLAYGFFGVRAFAHLGRGEHREAAAAAERAAASPGAHVLIDVLAAATQALAGDEPRARHWAAVAQAKVPGLTREEFFRAFPFRDRSVRTRLDGALFHLGF